MASYDFDLFVIGGGSGGIATARRAAQYGAKVGIAEEGRLGGTCVNRGCIPKKLMVYSSRFPHHFEEAPGYGWSPVESQLDWSKLVVAVNKEVDRLNGIYLNMLNNAKVQLYRDRASLLDAHTVKVGDTQISADKILIAVGGHPVKPDIPGIDSAVISDAMFALPEQPKSIVVLGGGYIGAEFACIMNLLGTNVTQIIRRDKILRGFDDDLRTTVQNAMTEQGIRIITDSTLDKVEKGSDGIKISLTGG